MSNCLRLYLYQFVSFIEQICISEKSLIVSHVKIQIYKYLIEAHLFEFVVESDVTCTSSHY